MTKKHLTSAKYNARLLEESFKAYQITRVVVAPGSRNAPIIMALAGDPYFELFSVPDERAAAFTALGMTLEDKKPTAVLCTSGSAAANFLPAVTEAYYQELPLLLVTADRPKEWIGQGIGQTIQQEGLYGKHILAEANLLRDPQDDLARAYNLRSLQEALHALCLGPVHVNVPFEEPLYDRLEGREDFRMIEKVGAAKRLPAASLAKLSTKWEEAQQIWILAGQMPPDARISEAIDALQKHSPFLLWSETLSNLHCQQNIACIDRFLNTLDPHERKQWQPDLVITIGGEIVSKMIKQYLLSLSNLEHWHLNPQGRVKDSFHSLTTVIEAEPTAFFQDLRRQVRSRKNKWAEDAYVRHRRKAAQHDQFWQSAPWSDFKVMGYLSKALPEPSILHCANSASIRYAQLFDHKKGLRHYANRGTSGIDGATSTAVGHATVTQDTVTLVSGDVAFFYDNAAFWNDRLPDNLKIILINNQGGNIFRIIKGPDKIDHFERFQETNHRLDLSAVAKAFGLVHRVVEKEEDLAEALNLVYRESGLSILEVQTPRLESPGVLNAYWQALR